MTKHLSVLTRASDIAVIALCVLAVTIFVRRESDASQSQTTNPVDIYRPAWRSFAASGTRIGPADAPVQVIELADFECPGCRTFYRTWSAAKSRFGDSVALTYVHYPLAYHRFALAVATAAECANAQGRFADMYALLFTKQDSIGLKSIDAFARDAHVTDSIAFRTCVSQPDTAPAVRRGLALGKALSLRATPTILVNGLQLGRPPSEEALIAMIQRELARNRQVCTGLLRGTLALLSDKCDD